MNGIPMGYLNAVGQAAGLVSQDPMQGGMSQAPMGPPPPPPAPVSMPDPSVVHPPVPLGTEPPEFTPDPAAQGVAPGVAPDSAQPPPHPAQPRYTQVSHGGVVPAHEVSRIGPSQQAAVDARNQILANAVGRVNERNQAIAAHEYDLASQQFAAAQGREAAANEAAAKQAAEMQARQQDFDNSVKTLSQTSVDPDRFWASRSTGQKMSALIAVALGGFSSGFRGGPNIGMDALNQAIDRDIRAQEFSYNAMRDSVNAKQTAFGMAMQKYQNADVARTVARAAALDAAQSQVAQNAALMKGTEAANNADMLYAALGNDIMNQNLQFKALVQAQQVAPMYRDNVTGLPVTGAHIQGRVEKAEDMASETEGKVTVERAKAEATKGQKTDEGAKYISSTAISAGIAKARGSAEEARKALQAKPLSTAERFTPFARAGAGNPMLHKAFFGQDAAEREQAWGQFKNQAYNALSGAAVGPKEEERLKAQFDSANDTESRMAAIRQLESVLDEQERTIKAGASPEAQDQYEQQKAAARTSGASPLGSISSFRKVP